MARLVGACTPREVRPNGHEAQADVEEDPF